MIPAGDFLVDVVHLELLHSLDKGAHHLHRHDRILLPGHNHDGGLDLLENVTTSHVGWGHRRQGSPDPGVCRSQIDRSASSHRMAGQVDALRINIELLSHNPENIQNILLAEFSQILGILRSPTQKIALSFSLAAIPAPLVVAVGGDHQITPLLRFIRDPLVTDHLVRITPQAMEQDEQGSLPGLLVTTRHVESVVDFPAGLLELIAPLLNLPGLRLRGKNSS